MAKPLADVDDVAVRMLPVELDPAALPRVTALLTDASAVVRNYTRRHFTVSTETVRMRPVGERISLPQRPVISVDAVAVIVATNPPRRLALPHARWDGGHEVYVGTLGDQQAMNLSELAREVLTDVPSPLVEITYAHGYAEVPDDVRAVVATMVARAMQVPGGGVLQGQGTGPYSYQLSPVAMQGAMGLDAPARQVLNAYRRHVTALELR